MRGIILRRSGYLTLMRSNPEMMERLLINMCAMVRRTTEMVGDLAFLDVEARLAKKILSIADTEGELVEDVGEVDLPPQHQLAQMIGTSRGSVNRLLGILQDRGAIRHRHRRRYAILKPALLRSAFG